VTPERYSLVKRLFQLVLEQPPQDRAAYLNQVCGADRDLYLQVRDLLKADFTSKQFLEKPAVTPISKVLQQAAEEMQESMPARIGPYAVHKQLGTGGMGAVYLASRADQSYSMQVAIKVIRRGMETDKILQRFRREREIVASLDHPNIARLLDGGATEDGRPYIVMEYVEGISIDRWCDRQKLNTEQRLRLFLQVCEAIHYAHQNLIIHRDIKPGNILVRSDGRVKLLDFGIAKILNPDPDSAVPDKTATSLRLMTPQYASPEQVKGEAVTTASDVYLLGIVLYELLTGHRPYEVRDNAALEIARSFTTGEPSAPSVAIFRTIDDWNENGTRRVIKGPLTVSATRDGTPAAVLKKLRGDVDAIVLKALRRDPTQRYQSAAQLADDIRKHLTSHPVSAREDSPTYRIGLAFRRNHFAATAAVAALFLLVFIAVIAVWQASRARTERLRAETRFGEVRKMANSLLFEVQDALAPIAGTTPARKLLIGRSLEYLTRLSNESAGDDGFRRELAAGYLRVGHLQGNPRYPNIGDPTGAEQSYRSAESIYTQILQRDPANDSAACELAAVHEALADLQQASGDAMGAIANLKKSVALREKSSYDPPGRAATQLRLAEALATAGSREEALALAKRADDVHAALQGSDSTQHRVTGHQTMARVLRLLSDRPQASARLRQAIDMQEGLPDSPAKREVLADLLEEQGELEAAGGNASGAAMLFRRALQIRRDLASSDPQNLDRKRALARSFLRQGAYEEAVDSLRLLVTMDPGRPTLRADLLRTLAAAGDANRKSNKNDAALGNFRQSILAARDWMTNDPQNHEPRRWLADSEVKMAEALMASGDTAGAQVSARAAIQVLEALLQSRPENILLQRDRAYAQWTLGNLLASAAAADRQQTLLKEAETELVRARDQFVALESKGQLTGDDRFLPRTIESRIEACRRGSLN
jgi:non-specific serine/threonine protein kinase/serine/threonine-protein kinase